jgi:hypothetical protein
MVTKDDITRDSPDEDSWGSAVFMTDDQDLDVKPSAIEDKGKPSEGSQPNSHEETLDYQLDEETNDDDEDNDEEDKGQYTCKTAKGDTLLTPHTPKDKLSPKKIPMATKSIGQQMCEVFSPKSYVEAAVSSSSSGSPSNGSSTLGSSLEDEPNMTGWSKSREA